MSLLETIGPIWIFYFPPLDDASSCTLNETFKVLDRPIDIMMPNSCIPVLKDDSMVGHYIGLNRMHPDRSSCLNLPANSSMG